MGDRRGAFSDDTLVIGPRLCHAEKVCLILEKKDDVKLVNLHFHSTKFTDDIIRALAGLLSSFPRKRAVFHMCRLEKSANSSLLGSLIASSIGNICLEESLEVLACLLAAPKLQIKGLTITTRKRPNRAGGLKAENCLRLGSRILQSPNLRVLNLCGTTISYPDHFAPGLAASKHIETLDLAGVCEGPPRTFLRRQSLADLIIPRKEDIGYGAVSRLMNDPYSSLRRLNLSYLALESDHLRLLTDCLREHPSRLEELNLSFNEIENEGIVYFASHLPEIKYLKKTSLKPNPWAGEDCEAALLNGLEANLSLEYIDSLVGVKSANLLRHFVTINRGGRRLLSSPTHVPIGVWPQVLARAGKVTYWASTPQDDKVAQVSAVFFLLRNSPFS